MRSPKASICFKQRSEATQEGWKILSIPFYILISAVLSLCALFLLFFSLLFFIVCLDIFNIEHLVLNQITSLSHPEPFLPSFFTFSGWTLICIMQRHHFQSNTSSLSAHLTGHFSRFGKQALQPFASAIYIYIYISVI